MIINPMGGGKRLPKLTAPGGAGDLLSGKQLLDGEGNVLTGAMPEAVQAAPSISVGAGGLITATVNQNAGHVAAGTRSTTHQLTVQAAQTIRPGTANQTIAAGRYLTGVQTIQGDANLIPANIRSGVSIFGVAGSATTVEMCTVVITSTFANRNQMVYYSSATQVATAVIPAQGTVPISVKVGSILVVWRATKDNPSTSGGVVTLFADARTFDDNGSVLGYWSAFQINGSGTLSA